MGADVLARDIAKDKLTDAFFGEGFEELLEKANKEGNDVVVGEFVDKPYIDN